MVGNRTTRGFKEVAILSRNKIDYFDFLKKYLRGNKILIAPRHIVNYNDKEIYHFVQVENDCRGVIFHRIQETEAFKSVAFKESVREAAKRRKRTFKPL